MRRLAAFWLAWALPAALWAAEAARPVPPIQLTLDFAAPLPMAAAALPAGSAAAAASIHALPATYQHVPEHVDNPNAQPAAAGPLKTAAMPEPVAQALKAGDAHAFFKAVSATGYELPRGDDHQDRLLRQGAEREAADRAFFDGQRRARNRDSGYVAEIPAPAVTAAPAPKPARRKRATKLDYAEFGRLLALTPRLSESPFRDTEAKRRILMAAGYTHLIGPGGRRIPLAIADEARVGRAFQHTLEAYKRR